MVTHTFHPKKHSFNITDGVDDIRRSSEGQSGGANGRFSRSHLRCGIWWHNTCDDGPRLEGQESVRS